MIRMKARVFLVCLIVISLVGCGRKSEIKVYRVSKAPLEESEAEQQNMMPANAPSPSMPGGMAPIASGASVPTPPNWEPQPLSQMRQASFLVKGDNGAVADISLVSLGRAASNIPDNVNRWLEQLGQAPVALEKIAQLEQRLTTSLGEATVVDLAGLPKGADPAKDGRIIAAIAPTATQTLFFKMRGNADLTEAQKPDFIKWVAAVCNAQTETRSPQTAEAPPQESTAPQLKWKTPEGWTEIPASSMRYASFSAAESNGEKIDISVVTFPGDGGSDVDNVNRWRQQIGLPPIPNDLKASDAAQLKSPDATFETVDIAGPKGRTLAAWTRRDGHVWFFKATGPDAAIEKEKPNFAKFVQSVRF